MNISLVNKDFAIKYNLLGYLKNVVESIENKQIENEIY